MRCTLTAAVEKLPTKNAMASTQNTSVRAASRSVMPGTADGASPALTRVVRPRRSTRAGMGMGITASTTARRVSARRQPTRVRSHAAPEGARGGDGHGRGAQILLHRTQKDGEAVVDDAPRDRLGDGDGRHDHPAVLDLSPGDADGLLRGTGQRPAAASPRRTMH